MAPVVRPGAREGGLRCARKYSSYTSVSSRDLHPLIDLCHRRWTIPLVAELERTGGERFAVLGARLGVARETLKRALDAAIELGLVERNPGYGHPLRPEYLLAKHGLRIAAACRVVVDTAGAARADLIGRKWSLPVLAAVADGAGRYSEIDAALEPASPRALTQALDDLVGAGCLHRDLIDERPPRPRYRLTRSSRRLADAARALADAASASAPRRRA